MIYKVIQSDSKGNTILYDTVMVDCGVSFNRIKGEQVDIVLLTHKHKDHYDMNTLYQLYVANPELKVCCCEWFVDSLKRVGIKPLIMELNKAYKVGDYILSPFKLYHDIDNCGWRIIKEGYKVFHATDTVTLEGISAKGYDLYSLETNHCQKRIMEIIEDKTTKGVYCHEKGSINSHLSYQKAKEFFQQNRKSDSKILLLHKSKSHEDLYKEWEIDIYV